MRHTIRSLKVLRHILVTYNQHHPKVLYRSALIHWSLGNDFSAMKICRYALRVCELYNNSKSYNANPFEVGYCYRYWERIFRALIFDFSDLNEDAVTLYLEAAEFLKNNECPEPGYEVYLNLGNVYMNLDKYVEAIETFKNALSLKYIAFYHCACFSSMGVCYWSLNVFEEAIYNFTKSLQLYPTYVDSYSCRARVYTQTGCCENALRDLEKVFEIIQDAKHDRIKYVAECLSKGETLETMGRLEEAKQFLMSATEIYPSFNLYASLSGLELNIASINNVEEAQDVRNYILEIVTEGALRCRDPVELEYFYGLLADIPSDSEHEQIMNRNISEKISKGCLFRVD
ncbi:tetratricopeptide repeat protein [Acrasis kona]|uniref:Tetratricopeptide repeat protein n=1 Tax=Acrasis kona TaxID=1008807 RepID=A0AAW2Z4A9_9EUKA